ncbi:succinate dehydrogenase, hydrophobic membrane anchor protein [Ectothiorhodospiraceae bacterium 2226]|nr:succinate dehydrogenase, hydrophobic membrane anchor protein [Ectothiorhodospiraceae bacterium 2226]
MSWRGTGLRAWVWQRLSALYLLLFVAAASAYLVFSPPPDHAAWRVTFEQPLPAMLVAGFVFALLVHAWVGMRDVIIDYVHVPWARLAALVALGLGLLAIGLWALFILLAVVQL